MNIGEAVEHIRGGGKACRSGWNGKNMHIFRVLGGPGRPDYVMMSTAQGDWIPWTCSQSDLLAEDWELLDP